MKIVDLPVEPREALGSAACRRLRRDGGIPIVLYGGDREGVNLSTTRDAFKEVFKAHTALVRLTAGDVTQTALVREVSWDTFGDYVEHLDLFRVEADDDVRVRVPFNFVGVPEGVSFGGETHYALKDVQVTAPVRDIPSELRLDVSGMNIGDAVHIGDYEFPEGVSPVGRPEELIVQVKVPKVAAEPVEEADGAEAADGADETASDDS